MITEFLSRKGLVLAKNENEYSRDNLAMSLQENETYYVFPSKEPEKSYEETMFNLDNVLLSKIGEDHIVKTMQKSKDYLLIGAEDCTDDQIKHTTLKVPYKNLEGFISTLRLSGDPETTLEIHESTDYLKKDAYTPEPIKVNMQYFTN